MWVSSHFLVNVGLTSIHGKMQPSVVKILGYRGVHLGNQVSPQLQQAYWDNGKLVDRALYFTEKDCKHFEMRKGTTDPYLYGPLPEFLKTYRNVMALEDGYEDGEADNHVEVPFRVLFLSLASSCLVSPGLNIYRTCGNL